MRNSEIKFGNLTLETVWQEPYLEKEEEYALIARYQETKDKQAAERLLRSMARFIFNMAKKHAPKRGDYLDDFVSAGMIGFYRAIDEFDFSRGVRFKTFAYWLLLQEFEYCRAEIYGVSCRVVKTNYLHKKVAEDVIESEDSGVENKRRVIRQLKRAIQFPKSLDAQISHDTRESMYDLIADESSEIQDEILDRRQKLELIVQFKNLRLNAREKKILEELFGLYYREGDLIVESNTTCKEIAATMGVTRQRIDQIIYDIVYEARRILNHEKKPRERRVNLLGNQKEKRERKKTVAVE